MRKYIWVLLAVSLTAQVGFGNPADEIHLAKIDGFKLLSTAKGVRLFQVNYWQRCQDRLDGAFLLYTPMRHITHHVRSVVGVMVYDSGVDCHDADELKQTQIKVPVGDVVDMGNPIALQPGQ